MTGPGASPASGDPCWGQPPYRAAMRLIAKFGPSRPAPGAARDDGARHGSGGLSARIRALAKAIETNDQAQIEQAVLRLSRSRRIFAPLTFAVGAVCLLFEGVRLLV